MTFPQRSSVSDGPGLKDVDVDGAVQESAAEAMEVLESSDDTRAGFLRRAGVAGGALMGGGAILGALASPALAFSTGDRPPAKDFGTGDVAILRYALTLEYLERNFYLGATDQQRKTGFMSHDYMLLTFLKTVTRDESKHVQELKKALGSKALREPKFDYHGDNRKVATFKKASFGFENTGVHAYYGQALNIKQPPYLAAALSIVTVEARHAAAIGFISHESEYGISPDGANDVPYGATRVLKDVKSLHYITKFYPPHHH